MSNQRPVHLELIVKDSLWGEKREDNHEEFCTKQLEIWVNGQTPGKIQLTKTHTR